MQGSQQQLLPMRLPMRGEATAATRACSPLPATPQVTTTTTTTSCSPSPWLTAGTTTTTSCTTQLLQLLALSTLSNPQEQLWPAWDLAHVPKAIINVLHRILFCERIPHSKFNLTQKVNNMQLLAKREAVWDNS